MATALLLLAGGEWGAAPGASETAGRVLGLAGPLVLVALLAFLVGRALVRASRYRAVGVLSDADRASIRDALAAAERKTVGEIVPVVVERSDPHPAAEWLSALAFLLAGSTLLVPWLPWDRPALLLLAQVAMGASGLGLARALPGFKRAFVFEDRATKVTLEQAFQEFWANGLNETEAATGVLLFVSLFEHRAVVLADKGIDAKVAAALWEETNAAILEGIRRGSLRDGLIEGIRFAGDALAEHFPWREGDRDEIPNRVVVRRE